MGSLNRSLGAATCPRLRVREIGDSYLISLPGERRALGLQLLAQRRACRGPVHDAPAAVHARAAELILPLLFQRSLGYSLWTHQDYVANVVADGSFLSMAGAWKTSGAVAYDRLKMRVDRATLTPIEIEAYAASGLLIKTLRFKDIKDFGNGIRRPAVLETDSPLYKGYKSVMLYANIKPRKLPDEVFTLNYLPRAEELRK